jgi:hypothetical protein
MIGGGGFLFWRGIQPRPEKVVSPDHPEYPYGQVIGGLALLIAGISLLLG